MSVVWYVGVGVGLSRGRVKAKAGSILDGQAGSGGRRSESRSLESPRLKRRGRSPRSKCQAGPKCWSEMKFENCPAPITANSAGTFCQGWGVLTTPTLIQLSNPPTNLPGTYYPSSGILLYLLVYSLDGAYEKYTLHHRHSLLLYSICTPIDCSCRNCN